MGFFNKLFHWDFLGTKDSEPEASTYEEQITRLFKRMARARMTQLAYDVGISYVASACSLIDFRMFIGGKRLNRKAIPDKRNMNSMYRRWDYRFNVSPNPDQSSTDFWKEVVNRILRKEDGAVIWSSREQDAIYLLDAYSVEEEGFKENTYTDLSYRGETLRYKEKSSDIIHLRLTDRSISRSLQEALGDYETTLNAVMDNFVFRNGVKFKLHHDELASGDIEKRNAELEYVQDILSAYINGETDVFIENDGTSLSILDTGSSTTRIPSADVVALRKDVFDMVATTMHIPPGILNGDLNAFESMFNAFLTLAVDPIAQIMSAELTRKVFTPYEIQRGYHIEAYTGGIQHADVYRNASNIYAYIGSGHSINDVRDNSGEELSDHPLANVPFISKNFIALTQLGQEDGSATSGQTEADDGSAGKQSADTNGKE